MTDEQLLQQARAHWKECTSNQSERDNRERGREDAAFAAGDQWSPEDQRQRALDRRPCLVMNKVQGFLHMVENEQRRNRVSIIISPVDDGADKEVARIDQGLVRYIQYNSKSEMAVQAAFVEACRSGLGALKLCSEYTNAMSFDQDLVIEQIPDAINRVWWDPFFKLPDRSDCRYAFEAVILPRDVYKQKHPNSEVASDTFMDEGYGNRDDDWITDSGVRVANYYFVEQTPKTIVQLGTGEVVFKEEVPDGVEIIGERKVLVPQVWITQINGHEVIEKTEWKGTTIPVFPVIGEEVFAKGQRQRFSLAHFARDPQRLYNYYRSNEAEAIGLAPKVPFIAAEGQLEGHEQEWAQANRVSYAYLVYKPVTSGNEPVPPPQRNVAEPPIQALSLGAAQAADDAKAAVSIYDASLGARSNETSGTAIEQRKEQTGLANLHFADNLAMAMCAIGRSIVEVKPFYYDTDRMIRILGEDETQEAVRVNAPFVDSKGKQRMYDLSSTKYDVRVSAGPSYMTQRQQAWASMTEWVRSWPALLQIAGDLVIRNADIPGADQIAERIKRTIDPNITAEKNEDQAIPPELKAQMDAMAQQLEVLTAALNEAVQAVENKQLELESRERIESMKAQVEIAKEAARIGSTESLEQLRQELAVISKMLEAQRQERQQEMDRLVQQSEPTPQAA